MSFPISNAHPSNKEVLCIVSEIIKITVHLNVRKYWLDIAIAGVMQRVHCCTFSDDLLIMFCKSSGDISMIRHTSA